MANASAARRIDESVDESVETSLSTATPTKGAKSWTVKGVPRPIRDQALRIAHGQGRTLGAWLQDMIETAARDAGDLDLDGPPPARPRAQWSGDSHQLLGAMSDQLDQMLQRYDKQTDRMRRMTAAMLQMAEQFERMQDDRWEDEQRFAALEARLAERIEAAAAQNRSQNQTPPQKAEEVEAKESQNVATPDWPMLTERASESQTRGLEAPEQEQEQAQTPEDGAVDWADAAVAAAQPEEADAPIGAARAEAAGFAAWEARIAEQPIAMMGPATPEEALSAEAPTENEDWTAPDERAQDAQSDPVWDDALDCADSADAPDWSDVSDQEAADDAAWVSVIGAAPMEERPSDAAPEDSASEVSASAYAAPGDAAMDALAETEAETELEEEALYCPWDVIDEDDSAVALDQAQEINPDFTQEPPTGSETLDAPETAAEDAPVEEEDAADDLTPPPPPEPPKGPTLDISEVRRRLKETVVDERTGLQKMLDSLRAPRGGAEASAQAPRAEASTPRPVFGPPIELAGPSATQPPLELGGAEADDEAPATTGPITADAATDWDAERLEFSESISRQVDTALRADPSDRALDGPARKRIFNGAEEDFTTIDLGESFASDDDRPAPWASKGVAFSLLAVTAGMAVAYIYGLSS